MATDAELNIPRRARDLVAQNDRLWTAVKGYWAINETFGYDSAEEVAARADLMEVTRLAFCFMLPQEQDDPENPSNPIPRGLPHDGPDDWDTNGTYPGGSFARLFKKLMNRIAIEKIQLGGP